MSIMKLDNLPAANLRRWTNLTKECYGINCICENCSYIPEDLKDRCQAKSYVLKLFAKFGKPERAEECLL